MVNSDCHGLWTWCAGHDPHLEPDDWIWNRLCNFECGDEMFMLPYCGYRYLTGMCMKGYMFSSRSSWPTLVRFSPHIWTTAPSNRPAKLDTRIFSPSSIGPSALSSHLAHHSAAVRWRRLLWRTPPSPLPRLWRSPPPIPLWGCPWHPRYTWVPHNEPGMLTIAKIAHITE